MHHDGGVRHFTPAPDAVVVQRGDDTMVELSAFDPVTGRMVVERTVHRDGAVRHASYFIRLPTPPEWVVWLEAAGFRDVRFRAGGGGPLELDSWEMVVLATADGAAADDELKRLGRPSAAGIWAGPEGRSGAARQPAPGGSPTPGDYGVRQTGSLAGLLLEADEVAARVPSGRGDVAVALS